MTADSYQRIKDFIFTNLNKQPNPLSDGKIADEILNTRNLIRLVGIDTFAQFLPDRSQLNELTDELWNRMQRELETHFDVKMERGVLIQGEEQQRLDNTWWTASKKQTGDNYYWSRYKDYISKDFSPEVVRVIDVDTDIIMDNIENPENERFSRYGMIVGHVQSGKTANYSALVCKAVDAGYKFIVVIAGGINKLRNQTQGRLNESFIGQDRGMQIGSGVGNSSRGRLPISLTTKERDFARADADRNSQGLNFDNLSSPVLVVIKKNTNTLTNIITWLKAQYRNRISDHAMLLIDDESDYASINTRKEDDPTAINKKLRELLDIFHRRAYIACTATPYANIFIDHRAGHEDVGRDLFPKDFIYALDAPDNYFGARKVFTASGNKHLIPVEDYTRHTPMLYRQDVELPSLPDSLYEAIRLFVLNISIRHLRGQGHEHNSMLIHVTRFTKVHQRVSIFAEEYIDKIKKYVKVYGRLPNAEVQYKVIADIKTTFSQRHPDSEYTWSEIIESLCEIIDTVVVREVHQKTSVPLEYRNDLPTNAVVVGGTSLSRGFTLEGLSISYFLRNTIFYDTLMQMGRWFGYRTGYEDLCRIYMPNNYIDNFAQIIEATDDLFDNFKRMADAKMTPNDFGLSVKHHPDSGLQVTARNKAKHSRDIYFDMKLDGHLKETSWLHNDIETIENNLKAIEEVVQKLQEQHGSTHEKIDKKHLWRNIGKDTILEFVDAFTVLQSDQFALKSRMPIEFVRKYIDEIDTDWDAALYGGDGGIYTINSIEILKEKRKVNDKGSYYEVGNRQVSAGNAESIVFSKDKRRMLGSDRKKTRAEMDNPLLMLHILQPDYDKNEGLAAFGISFPGGIESGNKTIRLKINTVALDELLQDADGFSDDEEQFND